MVQLNIYGRGLQSEFSSKALIVSTMAVIATAISIVLVALIFFCSPTVSTNSLFLADANEESNNRPIIGVLAQEISYHLNNVYPGRYHSYIAASYVKFVEGAGARVVPIWIGKDPEYYEDIMSKINGIVWPGGSTYFNNSDGYADAGDRIFKIARRMNKRGDYFPILGICLGLELLTYVAANRNEHRIDCNSSSQTLHLDFKPGFLQSRMFRDAPANIIDILQENNVTSNFHRYCITEKGLKNVSLDNKFRVLSVNRDFQNIEFISSLEHVDYPFYGVQFHPEKNLYEWILGKHIPHDVNAIKASQYFADFFINEARKNRHSFSSAQEEAQHLIYNYTVTYTALKKSAFEQCYMFTKDDEVA